MNAMASKKDMVKVIGDVDRGLRTAFRIRCFQLDTTMGERIAHLIREDIQASAIRVHRVDMEDMTMKNRFGDDSCITIGVRIPEQDWQTLARNWQRMSDVYRNGHR